MSDLTPQPPTLRDLLRRHTSARVGLASAGPSISTTEHLNCQLDHALARDAVHAKLDTRALLEALTTRKLETLTLKSQAEDRHLYLRRPDLGRKLHPDSNALLESTPHRSLNQNPRAAFILADGLSALAIDRHAIPLLDQTLKLLAAEPWHIAPICLVEQARVAIADEIGVRLHADITILLIGERPGLSAADSLGVYLTWNPRPGRTDAERNCISNIRAQGLAYLEAAQRILFYMNNARRLRATGITLKESPSGLLSRP